MSENINIAERSGGHCLCWPGPGPSSSSPPVNLRAHRHITVSIHLWRCWLFFLSLRSWGLPVCVTWFSLLSFVLWMLATKAIFTWCQHQHQIALKTLNTSALMSSVIAEVLCMVATPHIALYDWTQITYVMLVVLLLLSQRSLSLWCHLLFSYGPGKTTGMFLADRCENINKISCCVG